MLHPDTILQERYRVQRLLGRGGMGTVYEALDERLSRRVALKETGVETDELRRAFAREASLLANLQHPALLRVIDHFNEGTGQYIIMEFIPGEDLGKTLAERDRPFSSEEVLRWADQLLDALQYLHGHEPPVVHRDIKPSNLKLTAKGGIILLDFGLAKGTVGEMSSPVDSLSVSGYTPHYAALEQIQGERTSPRSDLYSLAATLYNLLTKQTPADALKRATAVINGEPDPLIPVNKIIPDLPGHVASTLMRALSLQPARRPESAASMRAELGGEARTAPSPVLNASVPSTSAPGKENLEVVFHRDYKLDDGRYNNNGWLQELPDPITKMVWDNAVLISRKTAVELGVNNSDVVEIKLGVVTALIGVTVFLAIICRERRLLEGAPS